MARLFIFKSLPFFILPVVIGCHLFVHPADLMCQQINSQVTLILERLPLEKQEKLKDFSQDIENYLNQYDWTEEMLDEKIPVTLQIFLQDYSVSFEERYGGTFMISNNSDMQYYDKYWKFPHEAGKPLMVHDSYEPFTGFLAFYINLTLGAEYDKYGLFQGTPYYEKAKQIADQALFVARFSIGWKERGELINYIISDAYKPFRKMKDLYYLGLSYIGEEDTTAQITINKAVSSLLGIVTKDPEHKDAVNFLRAHHIEMVDFLQDDQDFVRKMIKMDPDRAETYKKYLK